MKSIQRKQGGFSLVEILLVLGIIALLAIAAFIIFPQVQAANRANTEQANITTMAAGIKNLYGATRNYNGITARTLIQARIAPSSMYGNDTTATALTSAWSGAVTVAAAGTGDSQFVISYAGVPSEVCTRLVPGLLANFQTVTVGTTVVSAQNPTSVVGACAPASANIVPVAFTSN
jgi:prepilin-type N-terminal cleavage/methylation domain-containing protein